MFADFFQLTPIPANQLLGTYDWRLVVLSYFVAFMASYIALDVTGRLRDVSNTPLSKRLWICGGAIAMGAGIWSMHFIGMLAFSMPDMSMHYELSWTSLSLVVAILASGFALYLLSQREIHIIHLAFGGIVLGLAIAAMHYCGMEAMRRDMDIHYLPGLFALSIVIALVASEAALWFAIESNQVVTELRVRLKLISAMVMGFAICGMHYTGMLAAVFTPVKNMDMNVTGMAPQILAISIAIVTFMILGIAFFLSANKEALNEQMLINARQAGMSEVAVSVLHNVGNVLNSVNVSANLLAEKITESKLSMLSQLSAMVDEHKESLVEFLTQDPKGQQVPKFLNMLASYWQDEQKIMNSEVQSLIKNLQHIQEIISLQQNLSKKVQVEQIVSIDTVVDDAVLISGVEGTKHNIQIERQYGKLKPVVLDKVKLLQILVNLIHNAKDALADTPLAHRKIILKTGMVTPKRFYIEVIDNGMGISASDLKKIFSHGFTTKESGHGFGLHTSALAAKEMGGGAMKVASEGIGKGTVFTVELPYRLPKK
jgi:NO-binding membrane sensor protein with MHYT domain